MALQSKQGIGLRVSIACILGCVLFLFMYLKVPYVPLYKEGDVSLVRVTSPVTFSVAWDAHALFERGHVFPKTFGKVYQIQGEVFNDENGDGQYAFWSSVAKRFFQTARFVDAPTQHCLEYLQGGHLVQDQGLFFLSSSIPEDRESFVELCIYYLEKFLRQEGCPSCYRYRLLCSFNEKQLGLISDRETTDIVREFLLNARKQEEFVKGASIINKYQKITIREEKILKYLRNQMISSRKLFTCRQDLIVFITTIFMFVLGHRCIMIFGRDVLSSSRRFLMFALVCIVSLVGVKVVEMICFLFVPYWRHIFEYPVLVPFTGITLGYLVNVPVAAASCALFCIIYTYTSDWGSCCFFSINLLSTWYILFSSKKSKRLSSAIWQTLNLSWFVFCILFAFRLFSGEITSEILLTDVMSCFFGCLLTAIFVLIVVFVLELWLGENSYHCLLTYLDSDHPLLKRLFKEAPGTYQHSILVGGLAEAAAAAIGADSLFCRVASQYHDIGKLCQPAFFTENRDLIAGPHTSRSALESAQIIMKHVSYGVELARKEGLPESFVDVIEEHHGTTLISSIYYQHLKAHPGGGDIDDKQFRYPGRKPRTKEVTIIMIADSVEAAARSLQDCSEEQLRSLVDKIISGKMFDGQFAHSPLSLGELTIVAETMVRTLHSALHSRVRYPEVSFPLASQLCKIYEP